jgi:hypothetical protein
VLDYPVSRKGDRTQVILVTPQTYKERMFSMRTDKELASSIERAEHIHSTFNRTTVYSTSPSRNRIHRHATNVLPFGISYARSSTCERCSGTSNRKEAVIYCIHTYPC